MKRIVSIAVIAGVLIQGTDAHALDLFSLASKQPSATAELFNTEAMGCVGVWMEQVYARVFRMRRLVPAPETSTDVAMASEPAMARDAAQQKIAELEEVLEITFSEAGKRILTSFLADRSSANADLDRYIQHGVRIYEGAIMDHLFLGHVSQDMKALDDFRCLCLKECRRRRFFTAWLKSSHPEWVLPREFTFKRFHLLLLSVLELDAKGVLIHQITQPQFLEFTRDPVFAGKYPHFFRTNPINNASSIRNKIPYVYSFWCLLSLLDPVLADELDFFKFLIVDVLMGEPDLQVIIPHKSYAFWGDTIWARVVLGRIARDPDGIWNRQRIHEAASELLANHSAKRMLKNILRSQAFAKHSVAKAGAFFESAIAVAYVSHGGVSGGGLQAVHRLLTTLLANQRTLLGRRWPGFLRAFIERWLADVESRPLADPSLAAQFETLETIRLDAARHGFHPSEVRINREQAGKLIQALMVQVPTLPERYRAHWERMMVHTLAAIAAYSGYSAMSDLPFLINEHSWSATFVELAVKYSSDEEWRSASLSLRAA